MTKSFVAQVWAHECTNLQLNFWFTDGVRSKKGGPPGKHGHILFSSHAMPKQATDMGVYINQICTGAKDSASAISTTETSRTGAISAPSGSIAWPAWGVEPQAHLGPILVSTASPCCFPASASRPLRPQKIGDDQLRTVSGAGA